MRAFLILLLLAFGGCQSSSAESFRAEGRAATRELIAALKKVRTRDQLVVAAPSLKTHLQKLKILVEETDAFLLANPDADIPPLDPIDQELSDALRLELTRVMRLEGGQEVIFEGLS